MSAWGRGCVKTLMLDLHAELAPRFSSMRRPRACARDQNQRIFLRSAKPVAARVEREHQWPDETVLSSGHGAFASPSEQSGSSAKRTTT